MLARYKQLVVGIVDRHSIFRRIALMPGKEERKEKDKEEENPMGKAKQVLAKMARKERKWWYERKEGDKGGKSKKCGDQVRSLNAVSNDLRLGQLQSAYAKSAVAYQRERAANNPQQVVPPPPSQVSPPSSSTLRDQ